MPATNRVCIMAAPRTGSSLLRSLLDSQDGVMFAGEMFHPGTVQLPQALKRAIPEAERSAAARDADPVGFLARCVDACPSEVFGFKLFQGHSEAVREHVFEQPDWKIVLLYRENFLAVYASRLAARATGAWSVKAKGAPDPAAEPEDKRVVFDVAKFNKARDGYMRYYDKLIHRCAKTGRPFHLIEYAEVQRAEVVQNLARHLGFPQVGSMSSGLRKQGSRDILSRYANPEEVRPAMAAIGRLDWAEERGALFETTDRALRAVQRRAERKAARREAEATDQAAGAPAPLTSAA